MALKIGELWAQLRLETKDYESKLDAAAQKAGGFAARMNQVGNTLTTRLTVPLVAAGGAVFAAAKKTGEWAEQLDNLSKSTGLSTDRLQELKFVADQSGLSFEAITNSSLMLQRKLQGIEEGSGPAAEAMKQLGVNVTGADGGFRSMDELMPEVIAKLQGVSNETERNVLMSQLFGRSFGELVPLVAMGAEKYGELAREAENSGNKLSKEALEGARKFDDALDTLIGRLQGFATAAIGAFLGLPGWIQATIVGLATLAALAGPLMKVAAAITAIRNSTILANAAAWLATGGFSAMWKAMTGPVGWIVGAIAGIYGLFRWFRGRSAGAPATAPAGAGASPATTPEVRLSPDTEAAIRQTARNTKPQPRYA